MNLRPLQKPLAFIAIVLMLYACRKEDEFTTDPGARLAFSEDTLSFDTVFTQFGPGRKPLSVTKQLRVINLSENAVRINIRLAGNGYGVFKMNVDGQSANAITGKEILGKDSIYIFVQVYLQPSGQFMVKDQILFEVNGTTQDVDLVAYPRDANYVNFGKYDGGIVELDCNTSNLRWTKGKPYVIYDSVLVPEGCTLTIEAGTHIYSHIKSAIFVAGTLVVNGTQSDPVIFEGDRLEPDWTEEPGQWIGIRFLTTSRDNVIHHALIKNGLVGLTVDSASNNANPKLVVRESVIRNMTAAGLVGYTADLLAINNLVTNCGQFTFLGAYGGTYRLYHNTFATFGSSFNRQNPTFMLDNTPLPSGQAFPIRCVSVNNIIMGSNISEIAINQVEGGTTAGQQLAIQNTLMRLKVDDPWFPVLNSNGNIMNSDPQFENSGENNFELKSTSPVKGKGIAINIPTDLKGRPRNDPPSLGCFE